MNLDALFTLSALHKCEKLTREVISTMLTMLPRDLHGLVVMYCVVDKLQFASFVLAPHSVDLNLTYDIVWENGFLRVVMPDWYAFPKSVNILILYQVLCLLKLF